MALCVVDGCFRDARHRYACPVCAEWMRRQLREVETYTTIIRLTKEPGRGGGAARRAPGFGSKEPGDLTKIAFAEDIRTQSTGDGPDDRDDVPSLLGTLHGINRWLREELGVTEPRGPLDVSREIGWLLGQIEWCTTQQWVDEVASNIRDLHSTARRLAGDGPPRALGKCFVKGCDGAVYPAIVEDPRNPKAGRVDGGRCGACRQAYDWIDLIIVRRLNVRDD